MIPHDDLTRISFIIGTKLIQSAQSVRKFGMYVGRLSPGEMGVKRGGRDLVRGRLALHLRSNHLSLWETRAQPRSFEARVARARGRQTFFFLKLKFCGTFFLSANCVVIGTFLDFWPVSLSVHVELRYVCLLQFMLLITN